MTAPDSRNRWWLAKRGTDVEKGMWAVYERVQQSDRSRLAILESHARLYGNRNMSGLAPGAYDTRRSTDDILKYNLCRSVVDTVQAKAGGQRPRAQYITDGGKWSQQQRAKQLNRAIYGEFYRARYYRLLPKIARDAEVGGTGVVKVFADADRLARVERTYAWELFVDSADAWYGSPRTLYQRKAIDRAVLAEMYPKKRADIEESRCEAPRDLAGTDSVADRLEVVEAWRLPSSKTSKDGRHVIAIKDALLLDEPWTRTSFPFAFLNYSEPLAGFWGDSLLDDIKSQQFELNLTLEKKQEMLAINVPRTYVPRAAKMSKLHMSNVPGEFLEFSGMQPPIHVAPPGLPPEFSAHEASTKTDAYEIAGVSQGSATSQKPAGLVAGVAIREVNDIETERFKIFSRSIEEFTLDVSRLLIETMKEIAEEDGAYKLIAVDQRGRSAEAMDLSLVDLDTDSYVLQVYPTGLLPTRPEARLQRVIEMVESGIIDATDAAELLDFPDIDQAMRSKLAPFELVAKAIDAMLEKGLPVTPEPFWPLDYALRAVKEAYCRTGLMIEGPPEENRDLLRQCADMIVALQTPEQPPQTPAAPAAMAPPVPPELAVDPVPAGMPPMAA